MAVEKKVYNEDELPQFSPLTYVRVFLRHSLHLPPPLLSAGL